MHNEYGLAVCKNPGGTNGLLPVVRELRKDYNTRLLANGNAVTQLFNAREAFEFYPSVEEVLANYPNPNFLITSMCDNDDGGIGRNLIPLLRDHCDCCPTFGLQDYWGGCLTVEWADPKYRPDYIFVNDSLGAKIVLKAWPDFAEDKVIQSGFPMIDQYAATKPTDQRQARNEINEKLGVDHEAVIIFFPCGIFNGAAELLEEILKATELVIKTHPEKTFRLIPRAHPRLHLIAPQEFEPWDKALVQFIEKHQNTIVTDQNIVRADINWLLLASDVVVSDYSTVLFQAGILGGKLEGKANISILYPPIVAKQFYNAFSGLVTEPPFVTLECTLNARNLSELTELFSMFSNKDLTRADALAKLSHNQQKFFKADGQNARRVADFIKNLL